MKKIAVIFTVCLLCTTGKQLWAQNLQFSKVIDTVLTVSLNTSCSDMTSPYYAGGSVTVPAGKVWKVEGLGPLNVKGSTSTYSLGCSGVCSSCMFWGVVINDGQPAKGFLKRRIYNSSQGVYQDESINGVTWLSAGTSLQAVLGSTNTGYTYTPATVTSTEIFISIIEFTITP